MDEDPVFQLFPGEDHVDLYAVLGLTSADTLDNIKKAYRKLALLYHPDKHAATAPARQKEASTKFQQVGYAYAVLSDEKRRRRYDETGRTDEASGLGFGPADGDEGGWEAYFQGMFEEVTRKRLDEMKKEYQGSQEEVDDIKEAYLEGEGDIEHIMAYIPHSTYEDEPRIIALVKKLIKSKTVTSLPKWESNLKDEKAKKARKKRGEQEAIDAEGAAKELGVWDEFYGSGTKGKRGTGKKGEDDTSNLQALIQKRAANRSTGSFLDNLAAKYGALEDPMDADEPVAPKAKGKGRKKRSREDEDEEDVPTKKNRKTPELDDAEFERIQQRLEGEKAKRGTGKAKRK